MRVIAGKYRTGRCEAEGAGAAAYERSFTGGRFSTFLAYCGGLDIYRSFAGTGAVALKRSAAGRGQPFSLSNMRRRQR